MVQENILEQIDDDRLRVHVVWMPVLGGDDRAAAEKAPELITDSRATHYWNGDQSLGIVYGKTVELPRGRDLAWDIYFVFDTGVEWGAQAPLPTDWAHRLGQDQRHLEDGRRLRQAIEALLEAIEARAPPSPGDRLVGGLRRS